MNDNALLTVAGLRFGYPGCPVFLGPVAFELRAGTLLAVVGPNGAGKTTLLRLTAGLLAPTEGAVALGGRTLDRLGAAERARRIAFLPQRTDAPPDLIARDVVLLGRFPHRRFRFFDSPDDSDIATRAMQTTRTLCFAERTLATLSAGERQRVHLAAALAQQPQWLVLDEPTSALDPFHQLSIIGVLRDLCDRSALTVVVATHDLNLAGQFADTVLLLDHGGIAAMGPAERVLRPDVLEPVYGVRFRALPADGGGRGWVLPLRDATGPAS